MRSDDTVAEVRAFNRFYTAILGLLDEGLLDSAYSLTEVRVLFELAQATENGQHSQHGQHGQHDTAALRRDLDLDPGYLSRLLRRFDSDGLIHRERSAADGRQQVVALTARGREVFAALDAQASAQIRQLLAPIDAAGRTDVLEAMRTIRTTLGGAHLPRPSTSDVRLRAPEPGDYGWIVERNGYLYAREFGWDRSYEALVAGIVADFAGGHEPARERAWIAELDGTRIGCVLCVADDATTARLRLLLVDPAGRGHGVGSRLVDECVRFARDAGYTSMVLWTNSVLTAARRIYEAAGFTRVDQTPHHSFGVDLVGETWTRPL